MKNKIEHLRDHIFATIEAVLDRDDPMPVDRARAAAMLFQTAIDSARVEVEFLRVVDGTKGSGFIIDGDRQPPLGLVTRDESKNVARLSQRTTRR